ncbi:cupredoxin domain-containing protein [Roseibium aggregatum]|uniref:Cupredoxin domain-containing protein n=1 Tax=Roseibium aggregatum TaxID=187304 RepID=A0A926P223_9HYPH|nr:cupredoxin domain-containing protein [Roseibium aggregatum]MBD1548045.1 cupredoxin domain-containing protein [Roseibium aggregatum]
MSTQRSFLTTLFLGIALTVSASLGPAFAEELKTYDLELKDGVVTPNRLEVEAGTTFKIVIRNSGTKPAEFESLRLRKEKVLGPGVTSFVVIRRLSPGTYEFYDEFSIDKDTAHGVIVAK